MATQAQILANRRNAQKSTGPKTAEGKTAAAKNATKHGLFARYDVVISEDQGDYDALRESLLGELAPEGTMENLLAERIVSLAWRIKRAARMQNELIDVKIRREINDTWPELSESLITGKPCDMSKYSDKCYDDQVLGYIAMRDFAGSRALERLAMYERRFEASLFRTMGELRKLKDMRKKEKVEAEQTIPKTFGFEAATHNETQGRDALATEYEKQSQSAAGAEELSAFEKKEYELLLGGAPASNEANDSQRRTEDRDQTAANRLQRKTFVCRY